MIGRPASVCQARMSVAAHRVAAASLVGCLYPLLCNCMNKSQKQWLNCRLENALIVMAWRESEYGMDHGWCGGRVDP